MGVKPGYKETEVGVIPDAWNVGQLADGIHSVLAGVSVRSDETSQVGKFVLKTSALRDGKVDLDEVKAIMPVDLNRAKTTVQGDCIYVSRMNTPLLVGECGYASQSNENVFLPDRIWLISFKKQGVIDPK